MDHDDPLYLPPGFRFHPTDEEIVTHYLLEKIADQNFSALAVADANFNDCEPWDLPRKANMGEKEWFFFCKKDRKYPSGMRTNRATESGYWKATGKDKEIFKGKGVLVGMKKTLVFYMGRAPRGQKSNWVMHEYRLEGKLHQPHTLSRSPEDEWVVCKVYNKIKDSNINPTLDRSATRIVNSSVNDFLVDNPSMPLFMDPSFFNPSNNEEQNPKEVEVNDFYSPFFFNKEEELMRSKMTSDQTLFSIRNQVKLEQNSNSFACASQETGLSIEKNLEASSAISKHQINSLQDYFDDTSTGLQDLDFDSIMKYEFV